jgi:hypothetical protein
VPRHRRPPHHRHAPSALAQAVEPDLPPWRGRRPGFRDDSPRFHQDSETIPPASIRIQRAPWMHSLYAEMDGKEALIRRQAVHGSIMCRKGRNLSDEPPIRSIVCKNRRSIAAPADRSESETFRESGDGWASIGSPWINHVQKMIQGSER